jgi:hypothetical protein
VPKTSLPKPWIGLLVVLAVTAAAHALAADVHCGCQSAVQSPRRQGAWWVCDTASFRVWAASAQLAEQVAIRSESLRRELRTTWLGEPAERLDPWQPRCQVVVHATAASYLAVIGRGGAGTAGCSTLTIDQGRVLSRRIDLRSDGRDPLTAALPHELTHVVLADRFADRPLPRWIDEGIAVLADPAAKQAGHQRDLHTALAAGSHFRVIDLVAMSDYPPAGRLHAFYGQSAALVRFLVEQRSPAAFVDFVDEALREGYDPALRRHYGVDNVGELDRRWRAWHAGADQPIVQLASDN